MKKYKKIVNIKKIDENNNIEEITRESIHYIKNWQDLTREEKEEEIEKRQESIYESYQELLYEDFKNDLENIKIEFNNIDFENIYLDSNSQGWWIESINKICQTIGNGEFYCPYNLDDINDSDFFDWYFEDEEFEYIEEVK